MDAQVLARKAAASRATIDEEAYEAQKFALSAQLVTSHTDYMKELEAKVQGARDELAGATDSATQQHQKATLSIDFFGAERRAYERSLSKQHKMEVKANDIAAKNVHLRELIDDSRLPPGVRVPQKRCLSHCLQHRLLGHHRLR